MDDHGAVATGGKTSTGSGLDDDVRAAQAAQALAQRVRRRRRLAASLAAVLAIVAVVCGVQVLAVARLPDCRVPATTEGAASAAAWAARVRNVERVPLVGPLLWRRAVDDAATCDAAFLALASVDARSLAGFAEKAPGWLAALDSDGAPAPGAAAAAAIVVHVLQNDRGDSGVAPLVALLGPATSIRARVTGEVRLGADLVVVANAAAARGDAGEIAQVGAVLRDHVPAFLNAALVAKDAVDPAAPAASASAPVPRGLALLPGDAIPAIFAWCRGLPDERSPIPGAGDRSASFSIFGPPAPSTSALQVCAVAASVDAQAFTREVDAEALHDARHALLDDIALLIDDEYPDRCRRLRMRTELRLVPFPSALDRSLEEKRRELQCKTTRQLVEDLQRLRDR